MIVCVSFIFNAWIFGACYMVRWFFNKLSHFTNQWIWLFQIQILCRVPSLFSILFQIQAFLSPSKKSALESQHLKHNTSDYKKNIITEFVTETQVKFYHVSKLEYITGWQTWADKICTPLMCTKFSI